jgi:hypothetical protein
VQRALPKRLGSTWINDFAGSADYVNMAGQQPEYDEDVYELISTEAVTPAGWHIGATYTLEAPVRCPHCHESIRVLRVFRLSRTQVSFTSPLPRAGRVIICPQCERIVSAELGGLI